MEEPIMLSREVTDWDVSWSDETRSLKSWSHSSEELEDVCEVVRFGKEEKVSVT
jgi:hypothetical protein